MTVIEPAAAGQGQARMRLGDDYRRVRADSQAICRPLEVEDHVIQTMPDVSPPKWHLAHTSWFFETFLLQAFGDGYSLFNPVFDHLFNSYYVTHGQPFARSRRGLLARPTVAEVYRYRAAVDAAMLALIESAPATDWARIAPLLELGLHHEQQHQELLLTDIKHIFAQNPMHPAYRPLPLPPAQAKSPPVDWKRFDGGLCEIGHSKSGFAYDNEGPRHRVWLEPFALASRPVSNREILAFVDDGGYAEPALWMSDGWTQVQAAGWQAPLYWLQRDGDWLQQTLGGLRPLDLEAPACHLSFYEADAFARWSGKRLPSEAEWELAAATAPIAGNFREAGFLQPVALQHPGAGIEQMFGDVWEWTCSPYGPYPGYRSPAGTIGEYNGKFMANQMVLRGGSCVTPQDHIRASYRNFFYPGDRWQFSGLRLADEA